VDTRYEQGNYLIWESPPGILDKKGSGARLGSDVLRSAVSISDNFLPPESPSVRNVDRNSPSVSAHGLPSCPGLAGNFFRCLLFGDRLMER
jgi:hypothetical protein